MPRPKWEGIINTNMPDVVGRFAGWVGRLAGNGLYEVSVLPRQDTVTLQQLRYFHGPVLTPFADYIRSQEAALSPFAAKVIAKGIVKDRLIRDEFVCKETGLVLGSYVPSVKDLSIPAMSELIDRTRHVLWEDFQIRTPDADRWIDAEGVVATAAG